MKLDKYGTVPYLVDAYVRKLKAEDARRAAQKGKKKEDAPK